MSDIATSLMLSQPAQVKRPGRDYQLAQRRWAIAAVIFLLLFFAWPLVENAWKSFTQEDAASDAFYYYRKLLVDPYYRAVLFRTFWVSSIVTVICLLLSYPVAYYMVRHARRTRPLILFLLIAPLLTSVIMRTLGIRLILAKQGLLNWLLATVDMGPIPPSWLNGPVSVYIGMIHVLIPFMVLSIVPVIERIEPALEEAANVLGAGVSRVFWHVTLPLSREGIYTGCILVFMLSNGSFITQLLLGGGKVVTMPVLIFQQFNVTQDTAFAGAMGNTLLVMSLACLMLQAVLTRSKRT
ncbi:ABC transporter permease [soil metagenome]